MQSTLEFYNNIKNWILDRYRESNKECFFVALNAPQGSGKTTLTQHLVKQFRKHNLQALAISIDDFYLSYEEQLKLAQAYPDNPYLQQRGYPGTHDIPLGQQTLKHLKCLKQNEHFLVPRYDKSAYSGQGDRRPREQWERVQGPVQILLLEGWMLGFAPSTNASTNNIRETQNSSLKYIGFDFDKDKDSKTWQVIDHFLLPYSAWLEDVDAFIYLKTQDPIYVLEWRKEAEQNMKARGFAGMSEAEVTAYAEKFLPAYERYAENVMKSQSHSPSLFFVLAKNRLPVGNAIEFTY